LIHTANGAGGGGIEEDHKHSWQILFDGQFCILGILGKWIAKRCSCGMINLKRV
jgi:hypothetical protein